MNFSQSSIWTNCLQSRVNPQTYSRSRSIVQSLLPDFWNFHVTCMKDLLEGKKVCSFVCTLAYRLSRSLVIIFVRIRLSWVLNKGYTQHTKRWWHFDCLLPILQTSQLPDKWFFHKLICSLYSKEMHSMIEQSQRD